MDSHTHVVESEVPIGITDIRVPPIVVERIEVGVPETPVGAIGLGIYGTVRRVRGAKVPFGPASVSLQLTTLSCWVLGWSIREYTGTADATFELYDGQDDTGDLLATISLVNNESTRDYLTEPWLPAEAGVHLRMISGEIVGSLWLVVPDEGECD